MAGHSGGPWGGGGNSGGGRNGGDRGSGGGRRPPDGGQMPEIDELVKKGQDRLRVLMGGRGGGSGSNGSGSSGGGPRMTRGTIGLGLLVAFGLWAVASFYSVKPEEQSVELFLGKYYSTGTPGLNFAPWPLVTAEVVNVTSERTENIGGGRGSVGGDGLMLTTDANIVDIDFQVVWNINDPAKLLFNIRDPQLTVQAVSEAVMREIIAATNLAPILNRDRGIIADTARENIQSTLDEYESGISIVRVNLDTADPPGEVIDSFREVQAAEQERDRLQRRPMPMQTAFWPRRAVKLRRCSNRPKGIVPAWSTKPSVKPAGSSPWRRNSTRRRKSRSAGSISRRWSGRWAIWTRSCWTNPPARRVRGCLPYLPLNELRRSGQTGSGNGESN